MRGRRLSISLSTLIATWLVCGCVHKGPILVNPSYRAPETLVAQERTSVVGIDSFRDGRGVSTSVIGRKTTPSSQKRNDLVIQGTVADLVASGFKDAMEMHGIPVTSAPRWDMTAEHIDAPGADIVIGGEIRKVWVEVVSGTLDAKYKVDVDIQVTAADVKEKRILRRHNLSTSLERKDVSFSAATVEKMLSEALSSSIDQLLNNDEFRKSLR